MRAFLLHCYLLWASFQWSNMQNPAAVLSCYEGDIVLLLDSSGSVSNDEHSRLINFTIDLLQPFSLGRGQVRVGLVQVGTYPRVEFGLDVHRNQASLREALNIIKPLGGDTKTEAALRLVRSVLNETVEGVPKVLLWLTDGAKPGNVNQLMTQFKAEGVSVLAVTTVHSENQVLRDAVTPPVDCHLYCVDIEHIHVITEELREAIMKILWSWAERLYVVQVTSRSAVLQWCSLLSLDCAYCELWYNPVRLPDYERRITLPCDFSQVELTDLQPNTMYRAYLRPKSNQGLFNTLSVSFTTLSAFPDLSPTVVSVSHGCPGQIHVSWGPLQPAQVLKYIVEYGAIPCGCVHTMTLRGQQCSTTLNGLDQGTEYLITVTAVYVNGQERAMSVKARTDKALPSLADLQLTMLQYQDVQVSWQAHQKDLKGYWLTWERENSICSSSKSSNVSLCLPSKTSSITLTHLAPNSHVCVSPVYSSGWGDGICRTAERTTEFF